MYRVNIHTRLIMFDISNQSKHIPSKALVAQWVHPFKDWSLITGRAGIQNEKGK